MMRGCTSERVANGTVLGLAVTAAALVPWLAGASVYVADWSGRETERITLFPVDRPLILSSAVVLAALLLLWLPARGATALGSLAVRLRPLLLLWLWVIPYLPGPADRMPVLLVLAGPLKWAVLAGALLGCAWPLVARGWHWCAARIAGLGSRGVFLASLALYLACGLTNARQVGPGGDEPHYLIITHSLLVDRDLAIENNHQLEHYRAFFDGDLPPHYLRRGLGGVIYSVHAPGLPALVLPAYAIGGYFGVIVFLCVLAAMAARAVYQLAEAIAGGAAAVATWAAVGLTIPFVPHAWLVYPELPATLIVAWAARWLWQDAPRGSGRWSLRGASLALLPWLHTKFSLLLAALTLCLLVRRWSGLTRALAFLAPVGISLAAWLTMFHRLYGVADPTVQYGSIRQAGLTWANVPRGLLGLAFDQEFGVLLYSPVYWLLAVGAWRMWRQADRRGYGLSLAVAAGALVLSVTGVYMWWGGWSPPARFLVPALPLLAPFLAAAFCGRGPVMEFTRSLLLVSVAIAALVCARPASLLAFNDRDGVGRLVEVLQASAPLASALPSFIGADWQAQMGRVAVWLGATLVAAGVARWTARRARDRREFWIAATTLTSFGVAFAGLASALPWPEATRRAIVGAGRLAVLDAYERDRTLAIRVSGLEPLDEAALFQAMTITTTPVRESAGPDGGVAGPFRLLAGEYALRVWFHGTRPLEGEVVLASPHILAREWGVFSNPLVVPVRLPATVEGVWLKTSSPSVARRIRLVELEPLWIEPKATRLPSDRFVAIEQIGGLPGAYLLYLDRHAYPEGGRFWTVPGRSAEVWVAPAGARTVVLRFHLGPRSGTVDLTVREEHHSIALSAWQWREIRIPIQSDERFVPLRVFTVEGFRPVELDPASRDSRWLGCFVEVTLLDLPPGSSRAEDRGQPGRAARLRHGAR